VGPPTADIATKMAASNPELGGCDFQIGGDDLAPNGIYQLTPFIDVMLVLHDHFMVAGHAVHRGRQR